MATDSDTVYRFSRQFIPFWLLMVLSGTLSAAPALFGYNESHHKDISSFTQWIAVLERHLLTDTPAASCEETRFNRCHLQQWQSFIDGIRELPRAEQLQAVNRYANNKPYRLDIENYGLADYWASASEFLPNGGDCEDYAITKLFSLLWLDFPIDSLRIVVLQDTNLRIPHAILAYYSGNDILLLDNQTQEVVDHREIIHYVPVYSINEQGWWIHTPAS